MNDFSDFSEKEKAKISLCNGQFLFHNMLKIENLHLTVGPAHIYDKYYSDPIQFWNVIDYFKHCNFNNLSKDASHIFISNFKFTIVHFLCSEGNDKALKTFI